jgi:VWFA-related protein
LSLLVTLSPAVGSAQLHGVSETVEVKVVNFEVVVTDKAGLPISGLKQEDFELLVDGNSTDIDYFSAVEDGVALLGDDESELVGGGLPSGVASLGSDDYKPLLVIVFDGRDLDPGWIVRTAQELGDHLEEMVTATRGVMVVRQGVSLETEQVFSKNPDLLASAIERAGRRRVGGLRGTERDVMIGDIERAASPEFASSESEALVIQAQAEALLHQIKSYEGFEIHEMERSAAQLRALVRSLAGLPGRKELLYLGRGFKAQPARPLFELWWSKYSSIGPSIGVASIQSEMRLEAVNTKLLSVIEEANSQQITINTYTPGGIESAGAATQFSNMDSVAAVEAESYRQRQFLLTLARSTGGVSEVRLSAMSPLIGEMVSGFRYFYSLGFDLAAAPSGPGKVEVKVHGGDYRLRHLDRYRLRPTERSLEDVTLSALVTDLTSNPLQMSVDVDSPERQTDGTYVVPILVKVPISMLALLPDETRHVGKLQLVVQAQSAEGDLSPPVRSEIPIEIDNSGLLGALGSQAGYRLKMRVAEGEQKIAIAIRDEIAHSDSALNLILDAGEEK